MSVAGERHRGMTSLIVTASVPTDSPELSAAAQNALESQGVLCCLYSSIVQYVLSVSPPF